MNSPATTPITQASPFTYGVTINLAGVVGQTATGQIIFGDDSDFVLYDILIATDQDGLLIGNVTGQIPNNLRVQIKDNTAAREWYSQPLMRGVVAGQLLAHDRQEGMRIAITPKRQFMITVVNLTAVAIVVDFAFKGYKIFNRTPGLTN